MRSIDADALQEELTKKKSWLANARYTEGFNDALLCFKSMIHAAPTIEPEQKKGKWVRYDGDWLKTMCKCSECGAMIDINEKYRNFFCYHCGARMERRTDEAD